YVSYESCFYKMKVAIHQPQYLPWSGYFNKILQCDIFVFLDDVQYKKNEWQNRNKIKSFTGEIWLTVPVHYKFGQRINEVEIDNKIFWRKDHMKTIKVNYSKSKFFDVFYPYIEKFLSKEYFKLVDVNIESVKMILSYLGVERRIVLSSEIKPEGEKTKRLVDICKKLSAEIYISGVGAKDYLEIEEFEKNKIKVVFQEYSTPEYQQLFGKFIPNLSIIDMIFNVGRDKTLELIK
ncbi:MAG: WbqC family protein, partial [Elusimicrobiota bacterium]|nr:WbqC family protein [Endomicrobiia bacterium]MDW8166472.1 WbqC family protein [Elusimicrobiota bacterium]